MTHVTPVIAPTPSEDQGTTTRQLAAALVLADILDHSLPPATWTLYPVWSGSQLDELIGHVHGGNGTVEQQREAILAYAEFLDVEIAPEQDGRKTYLYVVRHYGGVRLKVWTVIEAAEGDTKLEEQ